MKQSDSWYTVKALASGDDGPVDVYIYDEIPAFGSAAANFARALAEIDASAISVHINSPGGSVFDGIAIGNALAGHPAHVTGIVDGVAASIASVIAVKCDTLVMNENSQLMLHNAWDLVMGSADDFQQAADRLRGFSANIATIYAAKAGGTAEEWQVVMDAETWFTAEEAVAAGLADEMIMETVKAPELSYARASFDLSKFKYPGREAAPAPQIAARAQTPPTVEAEKEKEPNMGTLSESALQKLGLDADADEAAIEAAIAALPEEDADDGDGAEADVVVEPTIEQVAAVAAKHNSILVDKAAYDQLSVQARDGAEARAQQVREQDDATIRGALASGRITPASEAEWRKSLASNRDGTKSLIATLPENTALAVAEVGHGVDSEGSPVEADKAFAFAQITGHDYGKGV